MNTETLPNQRTTWAKLSSAVEEFDAWKQRTDRCYASEDAELLCYLTDQLEAEGASLAGVQMNHPVLGLLSHMSESNNRMQELLLAYLSLSVTGDIQPARKLIVGQRLHVGLHQDYVAATRCYGSQVADESLDCTDVPTDTDIRSMSPEAAQAILSNANVRLQLSEPVAVTGNLRKTGESI